MHLGGNRRWVPLFPFCENIYVTLLKYAFFHVSKFSAFCKTLAVNFSFLRLFLSVNTLTITWVLNLDKTLATLLTLWRLLSSVNSFMPP